MFKIFFISSLILGIAALPIAAANTSEELAKIIEPCLDPGAYRPVKSAELFDEHQNLYAVDLLIDNYGSEYHGLKIIKVDRGKCSEVFSDTFEKYQPLSAVLPLDIAKKFRLSWETRMLKIYGDREETQEWLKDKVTALSPETQWAYKQLGFELRSDLKTCPDETPRALRCF